MALDLAIIADAFTQNHHLPQRSPSYGSQHKQLCQSYFVWIKKNPKNLIPKEVLGRVYYSSLFLETPLDRESLYFSSLPTTKA
jgi:hypothetical protein